MDTRIRTLVKAAMWTLLGLVSMSLSGLWATGSLAVGGKIALINTVIGLVCYVIYERVWSTIRWGRLP